MAQKQIENKAKEMLLLPSIFDKIRGSVEIDKTTKRFEHKNKKQQAVYLENLKRQQVLDLEDFLVKQIEELYLNLGKSYQIKPWLVESLFSIKIDKKFITHSFVENLFKNADFEFYVNKAETHIFSQKNELLEHDFGKLKSISALEAFQKYGIELLEKAKEKVYVKLSVENA